MYDWEIQNYLNDKNDSLSSKEYLNLCDTCPQIQRIRYVAFTDTFEIWTDEHFFEFNVYYDSDD